MPSPRSRIARFFHFFPPRLLVCVYSRDMSQQVTRLWLMYPSGLITRPVIYELGKKFAVVTNIRQASVTDEMGVVSIELDGERKRSTMRLPGLRKSASKWNPSKSIRSRVRASPNAGPTPKP